MSRLRVLLVEDNPGDAFLVQELLEEAAPDAFALEHLTHLAPALERLQHERDPWDVVLLDLSLPDAQGLDTVHRMRAAAPVLPLVVMSGLGDQGVALAAVKEGAQDYLVKGQVDGQGLAKALRYAVERARTQQLLTEQNRLLHAARKRSELLAALSDALHAARTPEQVAQTAASHVGPLLKADYMALVQQDGDTLVLIHVWGRLPEPFARTAEGGIPRSVPSVMWQVIDRGTALYTEDYLSLPQHLDLDLPAYGVALEPVRGSDGKVRAVLSAGRPKLHGPWLETERELMARAAATLGLALERAEMMARLEASNRALESRLALALESAGMVAWEWDLRHRQVMFSDTAEQVLGGQAVQTLLGERYREVVHPEDQADFDARLRAALEHGDEYRATFRVWHSERNDYLWVEHRGRVSRDARGRPLILSGIAHDITPYRLAEAALRESEARLRQINESQKRFVSDAAHELRAPLTAILGNLELMERFPQMPPAEREEALREMRQEARRMHRLVSDLLTLARGDGGVTVRNDPLPLGDVLLTAFEEARHLARGHDLRLGSLAQAQVLGDSDYLKQLALILLDNALKYTPPDGWVELELSVREDKAEFRVRDNGPGIPTADLPRVFERFFRADTSRSHDPGGSGLGLAIAKWIVESHKGSIWLESEPGHGTTPVVQLPLAKVSQASAR
ncbi:Sensor histidine kinase ResE [Calidithermus terrae]|uniref:histidine kinase n=1 Tax=Calidithermus terrae TaxID=1408545 RepID=A0A399EVJ9_9DEIN|nr:ATP-binding protein [Calidithermus terrae]RIH88068.1 Sensor histidine kinase ResE [Calidithermus terrae]